ncbi:unnamed protein product [Closterium sp. NIES-53]
MIALCQEHRTKHIALRYFLARELQQRGQLCLAYVATRANTADIFTEALPRGDHQLFSTVLGLRVDYFQNFSPTPKITTLRVLLHVAAERDYELHSLDFSTQWSLRRPVYSLRQAPRKWHDTLRTTLAALRFAPSTSDSSLFLHTDTSLPLFYVLVYVDDLVFATPDTEALTLVKSELQKRHTCTDQCELCSYLGLQITRDRARHTITLTQSHMVH